MRIFPDGRIPEPLYAFRQITWPPTRPIQPSPAALLYNLTNKPSVVFSGDITIVTGPAASNACADPIL